MSQQPKSNTDVERQGQFMGRVRSKVEKNTLVFRFLQAISNLLAFKPFGLEF